MSGFVESSIRNSSLNTLQGWAWDSTVGRCLANMHDALSWISSTAKSKLETSLANTFIAARMPLSIPRDGETPPSHN